MKSIAEKLNQIEARMGTTDDNSQKSLLIYIRDERFKDLFTDDYLDQHYPGYKEYHTIFIPDNGRSADGDKFMPYTISEM